MAIDPAVLRLMAITDGAARPDDEIVARAVAAVRGGATIVQLREKARSDREAVALARRLVAALPVPVLVNDRFDVALAAGAAGVHVGYDDVPVRDVRRCVPAGFIVGTSVGCEGEVANARDGADYAGIGPVYATGSKGDAGAAIGVAALVRLRAAVGLPVVAIGGIAADRVAAVIGAGVAGVAVVSAVLGAPDPEQAARALSRAIGS